MQEIKYGVSYPLFPYECIEKGSAIILYGFGKVGRQYYQQIQENKYCIIKYIVDETVGKKKTIGFIRDPEFLTFEENVKVVIAIQNSDIAAQVAVFLHKKGYHSSSIVNIHHTAQFICTVKGNTFGVIQKRLSMNEAKSEYGEKFFDAWKRITEFLKIHAFQGQRFVRRGRDNDGGYIMCHNYMETDAKIAYSFGINNDVSWDDDMADEGFDVYMYDHTINKLPHERKEFHYFKKGISGTTEPERMLDTLENIIRVNHHLDNEDMILKMDVEGAEYGAILSTSNAVLRKFDQIVMEFHNLLHIAGQKEIISAIEKLSSSFAAVHVHANNTAEVVYVDRVPYPDVIEVTLLNRSKYNLEICKTVSLPIPSDMPCWKANDEIILGDWNNR